MSTNYPPAYRPSPPQQSPLPPRKSWPRRHKILTALGAAFGLLIAIIIISVAASGTSTPSGTPAATAPATAATSPSTPPTSAPPKAAGIRTAVRDGKFQFTITSVTSVKSVGDSVVGQTAQGQYAVVHITVTNIANVAQTMDDSAQYVYDAQGRKFSADSTADIYGNGTGNSVFLTQINPGNSVHGLIYFDLPANDKAVSAELHDSVFSGGVTVSLTH
jgi:Domain of unknown function (DUF4352)